MMKAPTIDRVALTKQKMKARERIKTNAKAVIPEKYTKENSPFMKMVAEMRAEDPDGLPEGICPECGEEMARFEGCWRCKKCGTSLCG